MDRRVGGVRGVWGSLAVQGLVLFFLNSFLRVEQTPPNSPGDRITARGRTTIGGGTFFQTPPKLPPNSPQTPPLHRGPVVRGKLQP